jgi:hypothetical protein
MSYRSRPQTSESLTCCHIVTVTVLIAALLPISAVGQSSNTSSEGVDNGNYNYQGSFEFGYRFVNTNGNDAVYDTFVNQQQGPRLLEQTLSMRSLNHEGVLFDNLFLSSFGWGGDPENASRLRISKNKWYNFNGSFRRDQNVWDYNLLANPLNPPNPFIALNDSPHLMLTKRRMYDYNLTLLPQSAVRFRLGYTRNNMEGPAFSTLHEGTDALLFQNTRTLLDGYQAGIDIRVLPRTNISYDQFLQYYRADSSWSERSFGFQLADGSPVNPGMIYNPLARQPCSDTPVPIFDTSTTPPTLNATCNGYQGYSRFAPMRVSYPVEQLTLQSSYFRRVDLSARGSYSSADTKVDNFAETFLGLISRTSQRAFDISGRARAKRVVANADFGVTVHVTDKLRFIDSFRFSNFRIPGLSDQSQLSFFAGSSPASMLNPVVTYDPAVCPPTCPAQGNSSPADISRPLFSRFLGEDAKFNTVEVEYEFTKRVGARVGYRYGNRQIKHSILEVANELFYPSNANRGDCATEPLNSDGTCSFTGTVDEDSSFDNVHEHSALFGFWIHPSSALRINYDMELFSADQSPTRVSPRKLQRYKGRAQYKPAPWASVSGTVNILESHNDVIDIFHREHDRNFGFAVMMDPKPRFGFEFGYNYDDIFSTTNICYVFAAVPPTGSTLCTGSGGAPFISGISFYNNKINFGYTNFRFKPVNRVTMNLGYSLTSSSGGTTILSPTLPTLGPLGINYHKPLAWVDFDLYKGWTWRTAWNYYGYNEKSVSAPLPPRDFQNNSATLSIRYAF